VLVFLSILTVFRSIIDVVFEHADETSYIGYYFWDTWVGFFNYFMLESLIPSVICLLILGKKPSSSSIAHNSYASGIVKHGSTAVNYYS